MIYHILRNNENCAFSKNVRTILFTVICVLSVRSRVLRNTHNTYHWDVTKRSRASESCKSVPITIAIFVGTKKTGFFVSTAHLSFLPPPSLLNTRGGTWPVSPNIIKYTPDTMLVNNLFKLNVRLNYVSFVIAVALNVCGCHIKHDETIFTLYMEGRNVVRTVKNRHRTSIPPPPTTKYIRTRGHCSSEISVLPRPPCQLLSRGTRKNLW